MKLDKRFISALGIGALCIGLLSINAMDVHSVEKLKITDYGAVAGDGIDDSAAIQSALNDADGTGKTVFIPAGTWDIGSTLRIGSNLTLEADGNAIIKRMDSAYDQAMLRSKYIEEGYNGFHDVKVIGGTWDGNVSNAHSDTACNIFYFYHGSNLTIQNVTMMHVCGDHFIELSAIKDSKVLDCTFKDFIKAKGVDYDSDKSADDNDTSITSEAIQFDIASEASSYGAAPWDMTTTTNVTVSGCTFDNCISGVGSHHSERKITKITIANNTFKNIYNTCVNLCATTSFNVKNNKAEAVRRFTHVWDKASGTFAQNTCSYKHTNPTAMFYIEDATVSCIENEIKSSGANGIALYTNTGECTLLDNKISVSEEEAAGYRIVDCSKRVTIKNTKALDANTAITSAKSNGVSVSNSLVAIDTLNIASSGNNGIYIENTKAVGECTVTNCSVNKSNDDGIKVLGAGAVAVVTGNTVDKTTLNHGIGAYDGATATITSNILKNIGNKGIYVSGATATVKSNKIYKAASHGIYVTDKGTATITSNQIGSTTDVDATVQGRGIGVSNGYASITGNNLYNCVEGGIYVESNTKAMSITRNILTGIVGDAYRVVNCTKKVTLTVDTTKYKAEDYIITSKTGNGISVNDSLVELTNLIVDNCAKYGIFVENAVAVGDVLVSNCQVSDITSDGIKVTGKGFVGEVSNCTVNKATNHGVGVYAGAKATVTGNILKNIGNKGIYVSEASATVKSNKIYKAASHGIYVTDKGTATITSNQIGSATDVDATVQGRGIGVSNGYASITGNKLYNCVEGGIYVENNTKAVSITRNILTGIVGDTYRVVNCTKKVTLTVDTTKYKAEDYIITSKTGNGISVNDSLVEITNLIVDNCAKYGIFVENATAVGDVLVSNCQVSNITSDGIKVTGKGFSGEVSKCTVNKAKNHGIGVYAGAKATVTGNILKNISNKGIYVSAATATIKSNKIYKTSSHGIYVTDKGSATISSNQLGSTSDAKAAPQGRGIGVSNGYASITGNKLYYCAGGGIYVEKNTKAMTITRNMLTEISGDVYRIVNCAKLVTVNIDAAKYKTEDYAIVGKTGNSFSISNALVNLDNLYITSSKAYGIYVEGSNAVGDITINKCQVLSSSNDGIKLTGKGVTGTVSGCTVNKTKNHGIGVYAGANVTLSGNSIKNAGNKGIYVTASKANIKSNKIYKTAKHGIFVEKKSSVTISSNQVGSPTDAKAAPLDKAISISESYAKITSNKINNSVGGIYVEKNTKAMTIQSNTLTKINGDGIYAIGCKYELTIDKNTIDSPKKRGIALKDCTTKKSVISNNTIKKVGDMAVSLDNVYVDVTANTIEAPKTNGIHITNDKSKGAIKSNTINSAGQYGISILNCKTNTITVSNNTIKSSKNDSIRVSKAKTSISGNKISSCKAAGIHVYDASTADISKNEVKNSTGYDISIAKGCKGSMKDNKVTKKEKVLNSAKVKETGTKKF